MCMMLNRCCWCQKPSAAVKSVHSQHVAKNLVEKQPAHLHLRHALHCGQGTDLLQTYSLQGMPSHKLHSIHSTAPGLGLGAVATLRCSRCLLAARDSKGKPENGMCQSS